MNDSQTKQNLLKQKCVPCEGGTAPLTTQREDELYSAIPEWQLVQEGIHHITREFVFKNFVETLAFVNKVGDLAESEGHHPDLHIYDYKKLRIELSTHAIGGLSENDFIMAVKINQLLNQ